MMVYISTALFEIGVPVINTEAPFISRMTRILVYRSKALPDPADGPMPRTSVKRVE